VLQPPVLPKGVPAPWINIDTPHIADEWRKMVNNKFASDAVFIVQDRELHAHQLALCAGSSLFRRILGFMTEADRYEAKIERRSSLHILFPISAKHVAIGNDLINKGAVNGFAQIDIKVRSSPQRTS
jgi:hypothetical protein